MINRIRKSFTQIPNELINDKDLDRNARFLFVYLCSKPDSWKYFTKEIESGLGCSKDTRLKYMSALKLKGWISTKQIKTTSGTWGATDIILHAYPEPKNHAPVREPKKPATDKLGDGKNQLHSNTDLNNNTNLFSNKEANGQEVKIEVVKNVHEEVLEYLNLKKPSKIDFKNIPSNFTKIKARIKEGYNLEDFKKVIDSKVKEWSGEAKTRKWIRPETLFGQKFNGYLIAANDKDVNNSGSDNFEYKPTEKANFK